ncbi:MAG: glycine cleavage system H protein [Cytophagales bacterium]|nr:glycine cleavage system H protein [Cytophagales bacterium]
MNLYFTDEHQWARLADDGQTATIGISWHAQDALGDIVFVDLPPLGKTFAQMDVGAVVESVKTAADVLMPLGGEVIAVNEALRADPALANTDPMQAGWFLKIKLNPAATANELAQLTPESNYHPS